MALALKHIGSGLSYKHFNSLNVSKVDSLLVPKTHWVDTKTKQLEISKQGNRPCGTRVDFFLMQLEVRVYGATNLRFGNPFGLYIILSTVKRCQGVWEASCVVSLEIFTHTVALPKSAPKIKNTHPTWNRAVHFDIDSPVGKTLSIVVNETSDTGQQTPIGNASIPLENFQGLVGGQEGVCGQLRNFSHFNVEMFISSW